MKHPKKLSYLLSLLWSNPIFGDSYPPVVNQDPTFRQIENIYTHFLTQFRSILAEGMPHSSIIELNEILDQIAPKTIAFCTAISAGEIDDIKRLGDAALAIAISYWVDQSMDRGDEAMIAAVHHIDVELQKNVVSTLPTSGLVNARLAALRHIKYLTQNINSHPEDFPYMLTAIYKDVLAKQAHMRDLSRQYITTGGSPAFWDNYAGDVAETLLSNSGLMSAVTVIYAIYRYYRPELPSLREIYQHPDLMKLVNGPFNGAIRIFDDLGDQQIDMGQDSHWGLFNLNLFNQPNIKLLDSFLRCSGIEDETLHESLIASFIRANLASQIYATKTYMFFLRQKVLDVPQRLWEKYDVFLNLCKRTLEAGFVNSLGDILLTEGTDAQMVKSEILSLLIQNQSENQLENYYIYQRESAL